MRNQSPKRRRLMSSVSDDRQAFMDEMERCCVCGTRNNLTVHEMARGAHRSEALSERCAWLCACVLCNQGALNDYTRLSLETQLLLKLLTDPVWFDLRQFNLLRGRSPEAITRVDLAKVLVEAAQ